jgi:disulfide bond formation protein DsbB
VTADGTLARANWLALGIPAALLVGAYYFQMGMKLPPCEMCWWQRYPHFAALALALAGFGLPWRRALVALAALAILGSGLIGGFHAGVEYGWWEGITTCSTSALVGDDPLEAIMNAPIIRCDVAPWDLWGISLAGWNFLFSTFGALAIFALLLRRKSA